MILCSLTKQVSDRQLSQWNYSRLDQEQRQSLVWFYPKFYIKFAIMCESRQTISLESQKKIHNSQGGKLLVGNKVTSMIGLMRTNETRHFNCCENCQDARTLHLGCHSPVVSVSYPYRNGVQSAVLCYDYSKISHVAVLYLYPYLYCVYVRASQENCCVCRITLAQTQF